MNSLTSGKISAYLAIIFVAGGATGAVITLNKGRAMEVQAPTMEKACNRLQDRMVSKLGLTPDQVKKLQPVFDQTARDLRLVHAQALRETDQIIRKAYFEIGRELTSEQKPLLEKIGKERTEWLRRRLQDCTDTNPGQTNTL